MPHALLSYLYVRKALRLRDFIFALLVLSGVLLGGNRINPQGDFDAKVASKIAQVDCQFAMLANGRHIAQ